MIIIEKNWTKFVTVFYAPPSPTSEQYQKPNQHSIAVSSRIDNIKKTTKRWGMPLDIFKIFGSWSICEIVISFFTFTTLMNHQKKKCVIIIGNLFDIKHLIKKKTFIGCGCKWII